MPPLRARAFVFVCAAMWVAPAVACAQDRTSSATSAMAREQFDLGVRAANANDWAEALTRFQNAYAVLPHPEILFNLAGAQARTGHLLDAAASYRRFIDTFVEPTAAASNRDLAMQTLAGIERRVPHLRVQAAWRIAGDRIEIDGRAVPDAMIGEAVPLDPGPHVVTVLRGDRVVSRSEVALVDGVSRDAPLAEPAATVVVRTPVIAPVAHPVPPRRTVVQPSVRETHRSRSLASSPVFWTVLGVVVAAAAVTTGVVLAVETSGPTGPTSSGLSPSPLDTY